MNSEGFRETLSEERQRGPKGDKMAENNAGREERPAGVTEPSVKKLKEELREELDKLEERFRARKRKDDAGRRLGDHTMVEPGGDPGGTPRPAEAPDGGGPEGRGGIYVPEVDNTLCTRIEGTSIPRKRSGAAVQVRGRLMC